jgi:hypothetical protein
LLEALRNRQGGAMTEAISQADNLEINEVPDGYIIYQSARDRVHYLNKTAAIVFELCDGKLDAQAIVGRVVQAFELGGSSEQDEIMACLDSLIKEGLVQSHSR